MPRRGGAPVRVTDDPVDDLVPNWSGDGEWIHFASTRTGRYQVWKVPSKGGVAVQVTRHGGLYAKESPDRRYLYYAKVETAIPSLWRVAEREGRK